jgi:hypothetical protein
MSSFVREVAARARDFVLEPAPAQPGAAPHARSRIEVVVLGLRAGCGVTTLARGLALALQAPGAPPSLLLTSEDAARFDDWRRSDRGAIVWDAGCGDFIREVTRLSDVLVLIAGKDSEPALAEITADMLREDCESVVLVANRVTDTARWDGRSDLCVPESWIGAALLRRGRRPPGMLGTALARLAAIVQEGRKGPSRPFRSGGTRH